MTPEPTHELSDDERADEAGEESFPASDAPSWTAGVERHDSLATHPVVAFLATADAAKSRAFYEGRLGLTVLDDGPYALVLDLHGTPLRIQKVEKVVAAPYTALGWSVGDIALTVESLAKRGVEFERYGFLKQDARGVWASPSGAQVAWFKDPDGNTLSLSQE